MAAILTFSPSLSDRLTNGGVHLWELNRRNGLDYALQPPEAAIDPSEDAVSIDAAFAMRATFALDERAGDSAVLPLFDALAHLLTGGGRKH
jgi:hypothetical protein